MKKMLKTKGFGIFITNEKPCHGCHFSIINPFLQPNIRNFVIEWMIFGNFLNFFLQKKVIISLTFSNSLVGPFYFIIQINKVFFSYSHFLLSISWKFNSFRRWKKQKTETKKGNWQKMAKNWNVSDKSRLS